jgi:phage-related protein
MAGPLDEAFVEITAELDVSQVRRAARSASRTVERSLTDGVDRAERSISRGIGRVGSQSGQEFGEGFGSGLSGTLSSIADIKLPVPAFAALGLALSSAAAAAVQFAAALAPAVGIVATLPSGIGVLAAGMSTLRVATLGVGDAFSAAATGSAEEFNEAIEGMAPAVQEAAQAIRDLMPQLEELRNSVQSAFFQDFDDVLNSLAETLLGPVTEGMTAVAAEANGIITSLAGVATSAQGIQFVNQSFEIMETILARMREPLAALFSAFLNVGTALNEAFGESAGQGIADVTTRFAEFLNQAADSGQAVAWVSDALDVFQAIGNILSPIVGIIGSIGDAATATGGNILGAFGAALQSVDDFLASAQGQEALVAVFEALNRVGDAFGDVLLGLAPAIVPLVSGLSDIFDVVAPLLGPLAELVGSVLAALAPVLTTVASAIQPIIEPLTKIIELLGPILIGAIETALPIIEALAELLGAQLAVRLGVIGTVLEVLSPLFNALFAALTPIIEALAPLLELFSQVAGIIGTILVPIIQVLGAILLWVVESIIVPILVPAVELLATILSVLLTGAISHLVTSFQVAWNVLGALFVWLKDRLVQNVQGMVAGWNALVGAFRAGWNAIKNNVFTPIGNGINAVKNTISNALGSIKSGWNSFVTFVKGIPGRISGSLSSMFSPLASGFKSAINSIIAGWNGLSFTLPSIDLGPLGSTPSVTVSTPNIPYLAQGGLATGPTLAMIGEGGRDEAILPLGDPRVTGLLASALSRAGANNQGDAGANGGGINATGMSGDNYFTVRIGERELTDIVVEKQNEMNQRQLRRARAGTGRRS